MGSEAYTNEISSCVKVYETTLNLETAMRAAPTHSVDVMVDSLVALACAQMARQRWSIRSRSHHYNNPKNKSYGVITLPKKHSLIPKLIRSLSRNLSRSDTQLLNFHLQNQASTNSTIKIGDSDNDNLDNEVAILESTNSSYSNLLNESNISITIGAEHPLPSSSSSTTSFPQISFYFFTDLFDSLSHVEFVCPIMEYSKESLTELNEIVSSVYANFTISTIVKSVYSIGQNFVESAVGMAKGLFGGEEEEEVSSNCEDVVKLNGYSVRTSGSILSLNSVHMNLGNGKKMMINVSLSPSSMSSRYYPQILKKENKWSFLLEGPKTRVSTTTGGAQEGNDCITRKNKGIIEIQPPIGVCTNNMPIQWSGPNEEGKIFFEL